MSWSDCKAECAHLDASMLCITDDETNVWLANKLIHNGQHPWIGYSDLPDKQGKYRWIDGCSSTYTNWCPGEPNNIVAEDCTAMTFNGRWENLPDAAYSYTVCGCEYSTVPSLTPSSEPSTPSTIKASISTITIVIGLLLVVVISVSSTLLILYLYNMRMKQLQERRIHVYETEEDHRDEMDNRMNNEQPNHCQLKVKLTSTAQKGNLEQDDENELVLENGRDIQVDFEDIQPEDSLTKTSFCSANLLSINCSIFNT
jgi:hypothetical protein